MINNELMRTDTNSEFARVRCYLFLNPSPHLFFYSPAPLLKHLNRCPDMVLLSGCGCCYSTDPATAAHQGGMVAASRVDLCEPQRTRSAQSVFTFLCVPLRTLRFALTCCPWCTCPSARLWCCWADGGDGKLDSVVVRGVSSWLLKYINYVIFNKTTDKHG